MLKQHKKRPHPSVCLPRKRSGAQRLQVRTEQSSFSIRKKTWPTSKLAQVLLYLCTVSFKLCKPTTPSNKVNSSKNRKKTAFIFRVLFAERVRRTMQWSEAECFCLLFRHQGIHISSESSWAMFMLLRRS